MNHPTWEGWRAENPEFTAANAKLIGHNAVLEEIQLMEGHGDADG